MHCLWQFVIEIAEILEVSLIIKILNNAAVFNEKSLTTFGHCADYEQ